MDSEKRKDADHTVVVNHEDQYSIWLVDRELPPGWTVVGTPRTREECLAYIKEVWTDMRPRSLREQMEAARRHDE
jgi:MbtH protein